MTILYRGFSTVDRVKKFRVIDFELVRQDLVNHLNIRKGEKLMQPDFGTIVWSTLFEPLTDFTRQAIVDDIKQIVTYDPRISLQNITITEKEYGIQIELDLLYRQTNQTNTLNLQFNKNTSSLTTA
jgi:phage baseplate assembly protein W